MIRLKPLVPLLLLLAAPGLACMAPPCMAGALRGEILLDKDVITIGDIFGPSAAGSGRAIARAPEFGEKVVYDVGTLVRIARAYDVNWRPHSNYDRVSLTRVSQKITAGMVRVRVVEELAALTPEQHLDVALDNAGLVIHRPIGEELVWNLADLSYDPVRRRFRGSLIVGAGAAADVVSLSGRAMPMIEAAVLNRPLPRGNAVDGAAIDWIRVPIDRAGADAITSPAQLKDMETRRALENKSVLRLRDLTRAHLVKKGSLVRMKVSAPGLEISAQGRALADAVMGESLRVLNTQSNRAVEAVVTGKNSVTVMPLKTPKLAAAAQGATP